LFHTTPHLEVDSPLAMQREYSGRSPVDMKVGTLQNKAHCNMEISVHLLTRTADTRVEADSSAE
jgi:hypothetical protein